MPINKRINTHSSLNESIPEEAAAFLTFFKDKINEVPQEYRKSCRIEIEAWGDSGISLDVYYYRPENKEEEAARVSEEQRRKDVWAAKDLADFNRLKDKLKL